MCSQCTYIHGTGLDLVDFITGQARSLPVPASECGAMVPTSKCRPIAVKYLNSIPASMKPDDLIFKHSIPPELSEPLVLEPPDIPDGTSPDKAK